MNEQNGKRGDGRKFKGLLIGIAAMAFLGLVQGFICLLWPSFKIPEIVFITIGTLILGYFGVNVTQKAIEAKNGKQTGGNAPTEPGSETPKGA